VRRVVVAMAGADGLAYGVRLLETLEPQPLETHLVLTPETESALGTELDGVRALADHVYAHGNQAARISSGSFLTAGMIVAPCDNRSLAAIAMGLATNLVYRAADVTLKEQRPLVLGVPRAGRSAIDRTNVDRALRVPRLSIVPLDGSPDEVAVALLDQLSAGRD
jgi:polyprenyl P-hydroxybenzoate/phenylacrylic acid decarboxylase-like protein